MILKQSDKISLTPTPMLMRKAFLTTFTSLALTVLLVTAVPAMLIVDTGVRTNGPEGALFGWQWFFGQITTSQDYIITGVFWYISTSSYDGYPVTLTLSSDSSGGLGSRLFSQDFIPSYGESWQGVSGVNWNIAAGTYWVGFEVHIPD